MPVKAAIFLDRDDTLNIDVGYTHRVSDFNWVKGAPEALRLFQQAGLAAFIVTNQGGIGRGLFTEAEMHAFNAHLCEAARKAGGQITDIAFCPHHPLALTEAMRGPCDCRKPGPRMITDLARKWQIDLGASVMIGDRETDVEAGIAAGCHAYQFDSGDLEALAKQVLRTHFPSRLEG